MLLLGSGGGGGDVQKKFENMPVITYLKNSCESRAPPDSPRDNCTTLNLLQARAFPFFREVMHRFGGGGGVGCTPRLHNSTALR